MRYRPDFSSPNCLPFHTSQVWKWHFSINWCGLEPAPWDTLSGSSLCRHWKQEDFIFIQQGQRAKKSRKSTVKCNYIKFRSNQVKYRDHSMQCSGQSSYAHESFTCHFWLLWALFPNRVPIKWKWRPLSSQAHGGQGVCSVKWLPLGGLKGKLWASLSCGQGWMAPTTPYPFPQPPHSHPSTQEAVLRRAG